MTSRSGAVDNAAQATSSGTLENRISVFPKFAAAFQYRIKSLSQRALKRPAH
jgi:hypothetical protein